MLDQTVSVKTVKTYNRAVLVTGKDERGNEYSYFRYSDGWYDCYNENKVDPFYVTKYVIPAVIYVRFGELIVDRAEWVASGCPMELDAEWVAMRVECLKVLAAVEPMMKSLREAVSITYTEDEETDEIEIWLGNGCVNYPSDPRSPEQKAWDAFADEVSSTRASDDPRAF